jgi:hypothetical protein
MRRPCRQRTALTLKLVAILVAASPAFAQPLWKEIEAAARKEGALVFYHNFQQRRLRPGRQSCGNAKEGQPCR